MPVTPTTYADKQGCMLYDLQFNKICITARKVLSSFPGDPPDKAVIATVINAVKEYKSTSLSDGGLKRLRSPTKIKIDFMAAESSTPIKQIVLPPITKRKRKESLTSSQDSSEETVSTDDREKYVLEFLDNFFDNGKTKKSFSKWNHVYSVLYKYRTLRHLPMCTLKQFTDIRVSKRKQYKNYKNMKKTREVKQFSDDDRMEDYDCTDQTLEGAYPSVAGKEEIVSISLLEKKHQTEIKAMERKMQAQMDKMSQMMEMMVQQQYGIRLVIV